MAAERRAKMARSSKLMNYSGKALAITVNIGPEKAALCSGVQPV
jgi:hypothetical protein